MMRGLRAVETEGSRRLAHGGLGWYAEVGRKGEQAASGLSARFSVGEGTSWCRPSGRGRAASPGAIALMDLLVVALAGRQQVMQDLQPAVGEGTDRLEVAFAGGALRIVEGAGPGRARERAERPAQQRLAPEAIAGAASNDHARAA